LPEPEVLKRWLVWEMSYGHASTVENHLHGLVNKQLSDLFGFIAQVMKEEIWIFGNQHLWNRNLVVTTVRVKVSVQFSLSQILDILLERFERRGQCAFRILP
jgi:hypothetical protein